MAESELRYVVRNIPISIPILSNQNKNNDDVECASIETRGSMRDHGAKSIDGLEFLARSQSRVRLLDALSSATYLPKAEIRRQLGISRTTVDRHHDALEERNWNRGRESATPE